MADLAGLFSKESYNLLKHKNKDKRFEKINENIKHTGYTADKSKSDRDILYLTNDKEKKTFIVHRGTDTTGKKSKQDITADLNFALGLEHHDKHYKKRRNKTSKLVKSIPEDHELYMAGHSYGGSSVNDSIANKKNVRDKLTKAYTFNASSSPFTKSIGKKKIKDANDKVIHYRTKHDLVSASKNHNFGSIHEIDSQENKHIKNIPSHLQKVFKTVDQLKEHSIDNFTD